MTREEKQLLLRDLCARLPYGVMVHATIDGDNTLLGVYNDRVFTTCEEPDKRNDYPLDCIKPYLRPMSSMTEEERDELYTAMDWYGEIDETGNVYTKGQEKVYRETFYEYTDWLISHHFDVRGLIEKGLALEAPEEMYKTK